MLSPCNVAAAVASVTLTGMNFAPSYATLTAVLGFADCATSSWTTASSAACIGIRGLGLVGTAGITAAGVVGTSSIVFSCDGVNLHILWSHQSFQC